MTGKPLGTYVFNIFLGGGVLSSLVIGMEMVVAYMMPSSVW